MIYLFVLDDSLTCLRFSTIYVRFHILVKFGPPIGKIAAQSAYDMFS